MIVLSPPPLEELQWQATVSKVTNGRMSGEERSAARVVQYAAAAKSAADRAGAGYIDLIHKLKRGIAAHCPPLGTLPQYPTPPCLMPQPTDAGTKWQMP